MDSGTLELQVFISLVVILGAAFVALVCDYLKGNNESLREVNIDLRARRDENIRRESVSKPADNSTVPEKQEVKQVQRDSEPPSWLPQLLAALQQHASQAVLPTVASPVASVETKEAKPQEAPKEALIHAYAGTAPETKPASVPTYEFVPDSPAPAPLPKWTPRSFKRPSASETTPGFETSTRQQVTFEEEVVVSRSKTVRVAEQVVSTVEAPQDAPVVNQAALPAATEQPMPEPPPVKVEDVLPAAVVPQQEPRVFLWKPAPQEPVLPAEPVVLPAEPVLKFEPVESVPAVPIAWVPEPEPEPEPFVAPLLVETAPPAAEEKPTGPTPFWTYEGLSSGVAERNSREDSANDGEKFVVPKVTSKPSEPSTDIWRPNSVWQPKDSWREPSAGESNPLAKYEQSLFSGMDHAEKPVLETPAATPESIEDEVPETYEEWAARLPKNQNATTAFGFEPQVSLGPDETTRPKSLDAARQMPAPVAVSHESPVPSLRVPAGFQERAVLTQLLQSTEVLTGVVVAIGINEYAHQAEKMGANAMADLMRSIENMLKGLLRTDLDFGCRSSEDEFVLIFVNETGAEAQKRLTTISERLWNFQLRSLHNFSVLFSWGAVEAQGETLSDAAAGASERMYQTKRNRKTASLEAQRRKLAV
ncbi:MAG: diguanylate cyclase [Candidatus Solibacter usitatus]|nr:diguanylate cyclase [Candidatus Solibacter usitatus]